jgi:hypothetical protein
MAGKLGDEITLKGMFDHGRTELAAALLRHSDGHVMYMRDQQGPEQAHDTMDSLRAAAQEKSQEMEKGRDGPERSGPDHDRGMER